MNFGRLRTGKTRSRSRLARQEPPYAEHFVSGSLRPACAKPLDNPRDQVEKNRPNKDEYPNNFSELPIIHCAENHHRLLLFWSSPGTNRHDDSAALWRGPCAGRQGALQPPPSNTSRLRFRPSPLHVPFLAIGGLAPAVLDWPHPLDWRRSSPRMESGIYSRHTLAAIRIGHV